MDYSLLLANVSDFSIVNNILVRSLVVRRLKKIQEILATFLHQSHPLVVRVARIVPLAMVASEFPGLHCQINFRSALPFSGAPCSCSQLPPGLHVNIQAQATQCWFSLCLKPFAQDAFPSPFSSPINCLEAILISSLYTHI